MRWLITGGCGFVGANLADALFSRGDEVVLLDNLSRVGSRDNLNWLRSRHGNAWQFVEADIRNADGMARLVQATQPDALAHLAGQVAMTTSLQNPRLDFEVNALGTLSVLEASRLYSPTTIVLYSSTNKVYGDLEWVRYEELPTRFVAPDFPQGFDERIPLSFCSPYGCSKGSADQYMLDYARMFGLQTVVFRHSSMYGSHQFSTYNQGWIGWFCQKAIETRKGILREPFTISGNGKQVRDLLHADDVVQLYLAAVGNIDRAKGRAFNVGGGMKNSLSLLELFALLRDLMDVDLRFRELKPRQGDQKVFVADNRNAQESFGWFPLVGKEEGLGRMLQWLESTI
jgi:CDP-paratose 2-epimerase